MTVYYDSDVERLSPNSGETTVSWLKGSGLMSIEQLTSRAYPAGLESGDSQRSADERVWRP